MKPGGRSSSDSGKSPKILQQGTESRDPNRTFLESVGFDGSTTFPRWSTEIFDLGMKLDEPPCVAGMT